MTRVTGRDEALVTAIDENVRQSLRGYFTGTALIVALSLLVSNGPIQNVVLSWALGSSLKIHPVMVLISTIGGGVVEGILGMVLGPPVVSAVQKAVATVRNFRAASPHREGTSKTEAAT